MTIPAETMERLWMGKPVTFGRAEAGATRFDWSFEDALLQELG